LIGVLFSLHQKQLQDERLKEALHEAEKPLARYGDDVDLDAALRQQEREGDTMLDYIRKRKAKVAGAKSKLVFVHVFMLSLLVGTQI